MRHPTRRTDGERMRRTRRLRTAAPLILTVGLGLGACTTAQNSAPETAAQPRLDARFLDEMPAGTRIEIQLEEGLSTETNQAGDRWTGVVVNDVTDGERVLLQHGAVISGEVTRAGDVEIDGETRKVLAVEPTRLTVGGDSYALDADVVEADRNDDRELLTRRNVAILGGSVIAGAVLSEILFDEALLGAALGAAGGTAIAVATADTHIEFPEGGMLTLQLERDVAPIATRDR